MMLVEAGMKRASLIVVICVLVSLSFIGLRFLPDVRATTLFVGGAGPGNYTAIQSAIDAAGTGDTILVYGGVYLERIVIDKTVSLMGEEGRLVLIWGDEKGDVVQVSADGVNLTGFMVTRSGKNPVAYGYSGIELSSVTGCRIANNTVLVNFDGIVLGNSHGNTIAGNKVHNNMNVGILVSGVGNIIVKNSVYLNLAAGIALAHSSANIVSDNTVSDNQEGIHVFGSTYNTISNNSVSTHLMGIHLYWAENNTVSGNTVSGNWWAGIIVDYDSRLNSVVGNAVSGNRFGIYVDASEQITVSDNRVFSNSQAGILILLSERITLAGNVMTDDSIFIYAFDSRAHWNSHSIDETNSVNGKPVYYWRNVTGGVVPYDAGEVILVNCTNIIVENLDVSNGSVGIEMSFSSGIQIQENRISSNDWSGIYMYASNGNVITNNTFSSGRGYGTFIYLSDDNAITHNSFSANRVGLCVNYSSNNTIEGNLLPENRFGLFFHWSQGNTVVNNTVISSIWVGLAFFFSDVNMVYHNNFVDNARQAMDNSGTNYYDDGYPSGGNYWSDYNGVDEFSGPDQDQPGSDGIGDKPYLMTLGRRDYYPLMSPPVTVPARPPEVLRATLSGGNGEHVTVTWNLSPDDGQGFDSVLGYRIYRKATYDPQGFGYGLVGSLPKGASTFADSFAGEGSPDNYFYRVCAIDINSNVVCSSNQAGKFTRPLAQGPNLVSVPLIQSNESTDIVLQTVEYDKAWFYDSSSQEWKWYAKHKGYRRGLWNVNHTMGIWVNVTENSNLTVAGVVPAQTTIHLYEGWNLVSFPSFKAFNSVSDLKGEIGATRVEGYDSLPPYHLRVLGDAEVLQAGYAYWVGVDAEVDWIVEVS